MLQSTSDKALGFISNLLTKYVVWIIVIVVALAWWFYPDIMQNMGKIILFWGPAIALIFTLLLAIFKTKRRAKKDEEERGLTQYDITVTKWTLYGADLLVYGGSLLILVIPMVVSENGVEVTDLIQTLIYFIFATWLKQLFTNKIIK